VASSNGDSAGIRADTPVEAGERTDVLLSLLRLHWFIRLRWIFLLAALVVLVSEVFIYPEARRSARPLIVVLALAGLNAVWAAVSYTLFSQQAAESGRIIARQRVAQWFTNAQVSTDALALTLMLRYSGGVENPLALFYLFHMAIASMFLPRWQVMLQGTWSVTLYTVMVLGELGGVFTRHYPLLPGGDSLSLHLEPYRAAAAIVGVAFGVFGTIYLSGQIVGMLEQRDRELLHTNVALRASQSKIEGIERRRSRYMQTAAHQLKGPLAAIQTLAGLIRDKVVIGPSLDTTVQKIIRRCKEGMAQVAELLTLARVQETDASRHNDAVSDVNRITAAQCTRLGPVADERNVIIEFIPSERDCRARVDPFDLENCLANLIENAVKYSKQGGRVRVSVRGGESGDTIAINVADDGLGIEPDSIDASDVLHSPIFEAFRRGRTAVSAGIGGTGLGLAIVREVVERAGGFVELESELGHGTRFCVHFAVADPSDADQEVDIEARRWMRDSVSGGPVMAATGVGLEGRHA
jgi:signal transduction histidine kinase